MRFNSWGYWHCLTQNRNLNVKKIKEYIDQLNQKSHYLFFWFVWISLQIVLVLKDFRTILTIPFMIWQSLGYVKWFLGLNNLGRKIHRFIADRTKVCSINVPCNSWKKMLKGDIIFISFKVAFLQTIGDRTEMSKTSATTTGTKIWILNENSK